MTILKTLQEISALRLLLSFEVRPQIQAMYQSKIASRQKEISYLLN